MDHSRKLIKSSMLPSNPVLRACCCTLGAALFLFGSAALVQARDGEHLSLRRQPAADGVKARLTPSSSPDERSAQHKTHQKSASRAKRGAKGSHADPELASTKRTKRAKAGEKKTEDSLNSASDDPLEGL